MSPAHRRLVAALAGATAAALSGAGVAGSQLFKCVEGGRTVYQQQACPPSSQPEPAASAPNAAAKASAPALATAADGRKVRSPSPASSAPATPR